MGEDAQDDAIEVTITPFRLAKYELSYNLWHKVYKWATSSERGDKIYQFAHTGSEGTYCKNGVSNMYQFFGNTGEPETTGMPVTGLNWRDAAAWCNAFSEMCGLRPVYYLDSTFQTPYRNACYAKEGGGKAGAYDSDPEACIDDLTTLKPGGIDNPYADKSANGYRLPYEKEWEYAARKKADGTYISGKSAAGDDSGICTEITLLDQIDGKFFTKSSKWSLYGWCMQNSVSAATATTAAGWDDTELPAAMSNCNYRTHKQGAKRPTELGFYDMSGNIGEWCFEFAIPYGEHHSAYTLRSCRGGVAWYGYQQLHVGSRGGSLMYVGEGGMRLAQNSRW